MGARSLGQGVSCPLCGPGFADSRCCQTLARANLQEKQTGGRAASSSSTPTPVLVTYFEPLFMEVYVWRSAYRSLLFWHLGRVRGLLQERCCGHKSFFRPSLPTCHHALSLLFSLLKAIALAKEGEALLLSTPLPLPTLPCGQLGSNKPGANKPLHTLHAPRSHSWLAAGMQVLLIAVETMQRHLLRMYLKSMCTCTGWVGKKSNCSRHPLALQATQLWKRSSVGRKVRYRWLHRCIVYKTTLQVSKQSFFCMSNKKIFPPMPTELFLTLQQDFYHLSYFQACLNTYIKSKLRQLVGITYLSRTSHCILVDFKASKTRMWTSCLSCH